MSEAFSPKLSTTQSETPSERVRFRSRTATEEGPLANIQENTFFKIIFNPEFSPEQKMENAAKALEFTENKEENRTRLKEFDSFKEYMNAVSEKMSKDRIKLTDTEVFAELQKNYGQLNDDLEDFFNKIRPLNEIIDALYKLRVDGKTRAVLDQIREDQEWEANIKVQKDELDSKIAGILNSIRQAEASIKDLEVNNVALAQDKGFFGYGQIKAASMTQIKVNEKLMEDRRQEIVKLHQDVEAVRDQLNKLDAEIAERNENRPDSFEIGKLRELLDLTSEQHTQRQADMVAAALKFVESGKERFGSIRTHLDKMVTQIDGLSDNNTSMIQITAVLNEATKAAENANQKKREEYSKIPEDANLIEKMRLETLRQDIDEHIDVLSTAAVDTMQSYGELTTEAIKIRNMQAATKKQVESARAMHSRGISSVASQLSTVLTAVNAAGINEAQAMAASTLSEMARVTNAIAQKEAIRIATSRDEVNSDLEAQLKTLMEFGDTQREATEISRGALADMRHNLAALEDLSRDVQDDTREFVGVAADVVSNDKSKAEKPKSTGATSPFNISGV
ncbi:hypothetical protein [Mesorhizobium sp. SP-1A]|uniref:hypothetical protein n=1 Tax=Mesorhizobium sp. SP-1A TaxID=3077840 RepID=UPI0028F6C5A7|nr:hypothetical protein [Mesorhizobium sp. SP-1A]